MYHTTSLCIYLVRKRTIGTIYCISAYSIAYTKSPSASNLQDRHAMPSSSAAYTFGTPCAGSLRSSLKRVLVFLCTRASPYVYDQNIVSLREKFCEVNVFFSKANDLVRKV
jgi:hypothetical protein